MRALYVSILALPVIVASYFLVLQFSSRAVTEQPQVLASTVTAIELSENAMINQINTLRRRVGASEVSHSFSLKDLSNYRVADMVTNNYYSHTNPEGFTYVNFMDDYSQDSTFSCENLQLQVGSDIGVVIDAWTNSSTHNRCLMDSRVNKIAISYDIHSEISSSSTGSIEQMYVFAMIASN